jgi:hypothetical protein
VDGHYILWFISDKPRISRLKEELPGRCCSGNIVVQVIYPWVGIWNITSRAFFQLFFSFI